MKKKHVLSVLGAALVGAAIIAGPAGPAFAADKPVTIQGFSFGAPLNVSVGDRVIWTNGDSVPHTATSDPGVAPAFDTGTIAAGGSGSVTFSTAGTFTYFCQVHPNMKGTITVAAAAAQATTPAGSATTPAGGASPQAPASGSGLADADGDAMPLWIAVGGAVLVVAAGAGAVAARRRW